MDEKECHDCHGTGWKEVSYSSAEDCYACFTCDGHGKVTLDGNSLDREATS